MYVCLCVWVSGCVSVCPCLYVYVSLYVCLCVFLFLCVCLPELDLNYTCIWHVQWLCGKRLTDRT